MSSTVEIIFEGLALAVLGLGGASPQDPPNPAAWADVLLPATMSQEQANGMSIDKHRPRLVFALDDLKSANTTLDVHLTPFGERVVEVDLADSVVVFETGEPTVREVTLEDEDGTAFQSVKHLLDLGQVGAESISHNQRPLAPPRGSTTRIELPSGTLRSTHVILNSLGRAPQRFNYELQGGAHSPQFTVSEGFSLTTAAVQRLKVTVTSVSRSEVYEFSLCKDLRLAVSHFPGQTRFENETSSKRIEHVGLFEPLVAGFAPGAPGLRIPNAVDGSLTIKDGWCPSGRVWR